MPDYPATLALLEPDDLWPAWRFVDLLEKAGEMDADEAQQWRDGIFGLMRRWNLEPSQPSPGEKRAETRTAGTPRLRLPGE